MAATSYLASPSATRDVLERHGFYTKHRLGQNFLVSDSVIMRIVSLAELAADDVVLEVGPGIGTLTVALLPRVGRVMAVEADRTLEPVLAETCARDSDKLDIVWGDALRQVPEGLPTPPTKFVSNLPYQVAATIILQAFETMPSLERAVVMVQAEVADRIAAHPGTKAYGAYTAKLALWARVTGRFEVGPGNFMPPPHVDSAVVRIDRADTGLGAATISATSRVIDAAFAQRRKTIRNSMSSQGFDKVALDAAFGVTGISPTCRAETLAPEDFVRLAAALGEGKTRHV
ncbi:MAG: 16S rRNA (adenine(1518)-N(6)/adenine(1519)-N(6))-dimethyltransferase RsmA [Atopobiaceae bacterium]|nr:16S rRNA (adenine(1518)-N(6)/adenine(1519)-N(6))-dimethyltransferase RsmA [Atopobiaceae bacterium]